MARRLMYTRSRCTDEQSVSCYGTDAAERIDRVHGSNPRSTGNGLSRMLRRLRRAAANRRLRRNGSAHDGRAKAVQTADACKCGVIVSRWTHCVKEDSPSPSLWFPESFSGRLFCLRKFAAVHFLFSRLTQGKSATKSFPLAVFVNRNGCFSYHSGFGEPPDLIDRSFFSAISRHGLCGFTNSHNTASIARGGHGQLSFRSRFTNLLFGFIAPFDRSLQRCSLSPVR